jgi:hypothetical protein
MGIEAWSSTAASNNSASPNGAPEGWAPSAVNDWGRQTMASVRAWYETAQWINLGYTCTRASGTTFTISGDKTADFTTYRAIKIADSVALYGFVVSSSYSAPNTTVTVQLLSGSLSTSMNGTTVSLGAITPSSQSIPKNLLYGLHVYAADAGANDTYAITVSPTPISLSAGMIFHFKANTANTGAASLNINSIGAITIKKNVSSDLDDNDILASQIVSVIYDGTNFQMLSPTSRVLATEDNRTNTVAVAGTIRATTSGTPAANIGTGLKFQAESGDENPSDFGQVEFAASDVSAGSEDTYFQILLRTAGAALAAAYRFVITSAFKYTFTGAPTADRTITIADESFTLRSKICDLIGSDTASNSSSLTVSGLSSTYSHFVVEFQSIRPATDNTNLRMTLNGVSSSDYLFMNRNSSFATTPSSSEGGGSGTTFWQIGSSFGNGAADLLQGTAKIINTGVNPIMATWDVIYNDGGTGTCCRGGGQLSNNNSVTSVSIACASGNITSGKMLVYGFRAS